MTTGRPCGLSQGTIVIALFTQETELNNELRHWTETWAQVRKSQKFCLSVFKEINFRRDLSGVECL